MLIGLVSVPRLNAESTPPMPELWELVLQVVLTDTDAELVSWADIFTWHASQLTPHATFVIHSFSIDWAEWWWLPAEEEAEQSCWGPESSCWWSCIWSSSTSKIFSSVPPLRKAPMELRSGVFPPVHGPFVMLVPLQGSQPSGRVLLEREASGCGSQARIVPRGDWSLSCST